jgi:hypothetical protein
MDRTRRPAKNTPKFRRYDHFITGWATLVKGHRRMLVDVEVNALFPAVLAR